MLSLDNDRMTKLVAAFLGAIMNTVNAFRTDCLRELKKTTGAWPDLHYQTVKGALVVLPSAQRIAPSQPAPRGIANGQG